MKENSRWAASKGTTERRGKKERSFRKEMKALCVKFGIDDSDDESESEAEDEASVGSSSEHGDDEESPSANLAGLYLNE